MSLRHAILGLLAEHPASGYELLQRFDRSLAFVWPATQSQLYTELNKLAAEGMVEAAPAGPRGRKEYALLPPGRAELHQWLTEKEPERVRRSPAMLRVFFLWLMDPAERAAFLARERAAHEAALRELEHLAATVPWDRSEFTRCGRIALENGLRTARADIAWAEWAQEQPLDGG